MVEIKDMFSTVVSPSYLPGVASEAVTFDEWYSRKAPYRVFLAHAPDGVLVGHAALRLNAVTPDGFLLPRPLSWELGMVAVRPGYRGCGVASRIITELAATARSESIWCSIKNDVDHLALMARINWLDLRPTLWSNGEPSIGVAGSIYTAVR